jgi:prepilin-type N-terminal cleavage/methylation domain-containing protein
VRITGKSVSGRWSAGEGFTLIELVIVTIVLGIVAAVAIPKMSNLAGSSKVNATKSEMMTLKQAIVGSPQITAGGRYVDLGFEGNVGWPPSRLPDLGARPDSIPVYDKFTGIGWNGPYIDTTGGNYLKDAWGTEYIYDRSARTIRSVGGPDTQVISF